MSSAEQPIAAVLRGLDALEVGRPQRRSLGARVWSGLWPKLAAVALACAAWQVVVWSGFREDYVLPGPAAVARRLWYLGGDRVFWESVAVTLRRAVMGYAYALVIGVLVGVAVVQVRFLRRATAALLTGLQSMPSIAWFPLAILLFKLSEAAIFSVVVLGAAPSIANGVISGVDTVPPLLVRAGRVLGARGWSMWRHVLVPAALPTLVGGCKQAWAFAWRSLMAGELLVVIAQRPSLGARLQYARELSDAPLLVAYMVVVLVVGAVFDLALSRLDAAVRVRRGLGIA